MATFFIPDWARSPADRSESGPAPERPPVEVPALDRDRLFAPMYRRLVAGESLAEILRGFCAGLAETLKIPLVVVARKLDTGVVAIEAASGENSLWAELQHLPEHWDGTVAGNGPAARAIETGKPAWLSTSEEGMLPWRAAAARDQIVAAGAWPLKDTDGRLLQLFAASESVFRNGALRRLVEHVVEQLQAFFADWTRLQEQRLLAQALDQAGSPAFITDLEGEIVWCNRAFSGFYGYTRDEVRGRNPRMLQTGRQGVRYYRELWSTIRAGSVWRGETVDRDRHGAAYTVRQTISPFGADGCISHYLSMHEDISDQKAEQRKRELRTGTDPLGGLLHRNMFEVAVNEAAAGAEPLAVVALSLRGLARATLQLGDDVADLVRDEIGARVRQQDGIAAACMTEPGEYQLLLLGAPAEETATPQLLERLSRALREPFPLLGGPLDLRIRAGVARRPADGANYDELARRADRQLADQPVGRARRRRAPTEEGTGN